VSWRLAKNGLMGQSGRRCRSRRWIQEAQPTRLPEWRRKTRACAGPQLGGLSCGEHASLV